MRDVSRLQPTLAQRSSFELSIALVSWHIVEVTNPDIFLLRLEGRRALNVDLGNSRVRQIVDYLVRLS